MGVGLGVDDLLKMNFSGYTRMRDGHVMAL